MKKHFLIVVFYFLIALVLISGCTTDPNGVNGGGNDSNGDDTGAGSSGGGPAGVSARFTDNGDRSIYDSKLGVTWLKCAVGSREADCSDNQPTFNPGAACDASGNCLCVPDNSAEAKCANGVLCVDGNFVELDWRYDWKANGDNWKLENRSPNSFLPTVDDLARCQYFRVPDKSKEEACSSHGGVAYKDWRVPAISEISSLYDKTLLEGIDARFFPNTGGPYASTGANDQFGEAPQFEAQARKAITFPYGKISDQTSARVRCITNEPSKTPRKPPAPTAKSKKEYSESTDTLEGTEYDFTSTDKTWSYSPNENSRMNYTESISNIGKVYAREGETINYTAKSWSIIDYTAKTQTTYSVLDNNMCDVSTGPLTLFTEPRFDWAKYSTSEKTTFNGYEVYRMDKQKQEASNSEIFNTSGYGVIGSCRYDYFSPDFDWPLEMVCETASSYGNSKSTTTVTKFDNRDFDSGILTPPSDCNLVIGDRALTGNSDSPESYDSGGSSQSCNSECCQKCDAMQAICDQTGQTVNSSGTGCYTPSDDPSGGYQRDCYYVCLSI